MTSLESHDGVWRSYISSFDEDSLINKLMLSHDPDGSHVDSALLLQEMENVMHYVTTSHEQVSDLHIDSNVFSEIKNIKVVGSQEHLGDTISKISLQMLYKPSGEKDLHAKTMALFDLLGSFRWDGKVVLVLVAFATNYGGFWLLNRLYSRNPLAASIATLKRVPADTTGCKFQYKALTLLVKTMVDVTKCIIEFGNLSLTSAKLHKVAQTATTSQIYVAAYWVIRSSLTCSSRITDMRVRKPEQVHSCSAIATWELNSLRYRLSRIYTHLRQQVDLCQQQTDVEIYRTLLNLSTVTLGDDNQEILQLLFALRDDFPLKYCSEQVGTSELKDKVVILLVSNPELLPLESLFFLVNQTCIHSQNSNIDESYGVLWVPLSSSVTWHDDEEKSFNALSNSLPWYSVKQPWLLNSAVTDFIKKEWGFRGEPIMVVLNSLGKVTNFNALDMVFVWGTPKAYPFSVHRENELWDDELWSLPLIVDEIDPLLTKWMEEGRNICIYGSNNIDYISEFNHKLKGILSGVGAGEQLEMVYVGNRNYSDEHTKNMLATLSKEEGSLLSFTKVEYFWLRLESMKRSKLRLKKTPENDHILKELSALLDIDDADKIWAIYGSGSSSTDIVRLQGDKLMECLNKFRLDLVKSGFMTALKTSVDPDILVEPCNHSNVIPYAEGLIEGNALCPKCKLPMEKFIVFE